MSIDSICENIRKFLVSIVNMCITKKQGEMIVREFENNIKREEKLDNFSNKVTDIYEYINRLENNNKALVVILIEMVKHKNNNEFNMILEKLEYVENLLNTKE